VERSTSQSTAQVPDPAGLAVRFARVAVDNVTREFPNAPAHLITGPGDLAPPRAHHPAFYGSYDWHSSVHMHWLLVRLLRRHAAVIDVAGVREVLDRHLTAEHLATEAAYLRGNPSFERPYGWAWLLALAAECRAAAQDPAVEDTGRENTGRENTGRGNTAREDAAGWAEAMRPAVQTVAALIEAWLRKATYPVRHGVHGNSAFALGLVLDSAAGAGCPGLVPAVAGAVERWFGADRDYPAAWEPSGQDFLSPALTEADVMRRVLPDAEFAGWLTDFLPGLAKGEPRAVLEPPAVSDPRDPQIGHLVGLAFSRSAALAAIARALPEGDDRISVLRAAARVQLDAALPLVIAGDFTSDHWLATFATLALEAAGLDRGDVGGRTGLGALTFKA
jgi:hypothetical protein